MPSEITQKEIDELIQQTQKDFKKDSTILGILFFIFGVIIYFVILNLPSFSDAQKVILFQIPRTAQDLNDIAQVIMSYSESNYYGLMAAFVCMYLFLQTFAIPGPVFLSILSGTLFGGVEGTCIVCVSATIGSAM